MLRMLMAAVLALSLTFARASSIAPMSSERAISWWWAAPEGTDGTDNATQGMLRFVKDNKDIVTTVIMRCGIVTCVRNATRGDCTNNNGTGGVITGTLMPACEKVLPTLKELGIRAELWLGEDDSILSARYMFKHSNDVATALVGVAHLYPGIVGFNIDLENGNGTQQDKTDYSNFLGDVTKRLNSAPGGPFRFSADVSCGSTWSEIEGDCEYLAKSGVNRLMNMRTYNSGSYDGWWYAAFEPALGTPRNVLGIGLGCWIDYRTNNTWNVQPESATSRICAIMNQSISEIDMFIIRQGSPIAEENFPEPFWIPALRSYMSGTSCNADIPPKITCPNASIGPANSWTIGDDAGCCIASANRGHGIECNKTCAEAECAKAKMFWRPENYTVHPYECCMKPTPTSLQTEAFNNDILG